MEIIKVENGQATFNLNGEQLVRKIRKQAKRNVIIHNRDTYVLSDDLKSVSLVNKVPSANGLAPMVETPTESEFDINTRFDFLEKFTNMTLDKIIASTIIAGEAGIGKSMTVFQELEKRGLEQDEDYVIIKGYSTPKALFATLYENLDKIVIFDDCDSVLKDPISVNLLKGALDSYSKRTISWLSKGFIDDGLPSSFDFEGQVIFISNLPMSKIDGAVKSRSMVIDLSMTISDKLKRMQTILPDLLPEVDMGIKQETLDYVSENAYEAKELNLRTLQKCIRVHQAYEGNEQWKDAVKYLLTNV